MAANFSHPTGFSLRLNTAGTLALVLTNTNVRTSTVATGFTDGTMYGVRVTADGTNVYFYTRTDWQNIDSDTGWTQLGAAVASTTSMGASTADLLVGKEVNGGYGWPGSINKFIFKISGSVVADADFGTPWVSDAYTDSAANSWTIAGTGRTYSQVVPA